MNGLAKEWILARSIRWVVCLFLQIYKLAYIYCLSTEVPLLTPRCRSAVGSALRAHASYTKAERWRERRRIEVATAQCLESLYLGVLTELSPPFLYNEHYRRLSVWTISRRSYLNKELLYHKSGSCKEDVQAIISDSTIFFMKADHNPSSRLITYAVIASMCQLLYSHAERCGHSWLTIQTPCIKSATFTTCPKLRNGGYRVNRLDIYEDTLFLVPRRKCVECNRSYSEQRRNSGHARQSSGDADSAIRKQLQECTCSGVEEL